MLRRYSLWQSVASHIRGRFVFEGHKKTIVQVQKWVAKNPDWKSPQQRSQLKRQVTAKLSPGFMKSKSSSKLAKVSQRRRRRRRRRRTEHQKSRVDSKCRTASGYATPPPPPTVKGECWRPKRCHHQRHHICRGWRECEVECLALPLGVRIGSR